MKTYYIYLTDLFCGDLNFNWVTKLKVKATTERGAVSKVSRRSGLNFRKDSEGVYFSSTKLTGLVIDDEEYPQYDYSNAEEI